MNANEYKIKIEDPCAFSAKDILETRDLLKANNAQEISVIDCAMGQGGITKPELHESKDTFDYYMVRCNFDEADTIASHLFEAEFSAVPSSGETTPEASRYADLCDRWSKFRDWLERGGKV